jgi:hypothetical protein
MPPGPADEAAIAHARQIVAEGTERSAHFWAIVVRQHECGRGRRDGR